MLTIEHITAKEIPSLRLKGRLDSASERAAQEQVMAAAGDGRAALLLDMSQVDYVSSAGLRVLVLAAKRAKSRGIPIALCGIQDHLRELLDISDLLDFFGLHPTVAAAIEAAG